MNTSIDSLQDGWYKIAANLESIAFNEKGIAGVFVNGEPICLIKTNQGLKACTDKCPHAGSSLSHHGFMDNRNNIVCCVHNYRFNVLNGRDALNEGYKLKLYPIRISPEGIYIQLKSK